MMLLARVSKCVLWFLASESAAFYCVGSAAVLVELGGGARASGAETARCDSSATGAGRLGNPTTVIASVLLELAGLL